MREVLRKIVLQVTPSVVIRRDIRKIASLEKRVPSGNNLARMLKENREEREHVLSRRFWTRRAAV